MKASPYHLMQAVENGLLSDSVEVLNQFRDTHTVTYSTGKLVAVFEQDISTGYTTQPHVDLISTPAGFVHIY